MAPGDLGRVIGRQGRTAQAMRTLVARRPSSKGSRRRSSSATSDASRESDANRVEMRSDLLLVGRVARAHGNRGQVIVNPETDFAEERFRVGHACCSWDRPIDRRRARLRAARFHQGRPIVALDGVDTMNDAEALAGVGAAGCRRRRLPPLPRRHVLPARPGRLRGAGRGGRDASAG